MYDLAHNDCIDKLLAYDPIDIHDQDKTKQRGITLTRKEKKIEGGKFGMQPKKDNPHKYDFTLE